eukprot:577642-Prymnesium_polylepis.1
MPRRNCTCGLHTANVASRRCVAPRPPAPAALEAGRDSRGRHRPRRTVGVHDGPADAHRAGRVARQGDQRDALRQDAAHGAH